MSHNLEVRPHGFDNRVGWLPANTLDQAYRLHRLYGGVVVDPVTGIDYTPAPSTTRENDQ